MKAQGAKEKFDSSHSNNAAIVHKSVFLDVLEEISDFRSDPFTLIDLVLPRNSYMIACTNTHSFVGEGENSAFTILVAQLEPLFLILGSDITLIGSNFKFEEPPIMLVVVLINFVVENKALKSL